ncbi:MAG: hypothetical protein LBH05_04410 [Deferribacteraceae bacterium]|nr:hypothetical protein [Deferribacteraceae bacterium]
MTRLTAVNIICFFIFVSVVWAQPAKTGYININADTMKYFGSIYKSSFSGNVYASNDNFTLTSDNVDVYFSEKNEVLRIVCRGQVVFKSSDILATSDNAELKQPTKIITLEGNAEIWQNDNYLKGAKVAIQYEKKEIHVEKGQNSRVTVIFKPDDNMSFP